MALNRPLSSSFDHSLLASLVQESLSKDTEDTSASIISGLLGATSLLLKLEQLQFLLSLFSGVGDRGIDQGSDSGRKLSRLDTERVGELEDLGLNITTGLFTGTSGSPGLVSLVPFHCEV
jgi:hypothetical protein